MAISKPTKNARTTDGKVLTDTMMKSGEWVREVEVLELTGLHITSLRDKRRQNLIGALPVSRGSNGQGRSYWYARSDVEALVARRHPRDLPELDSWSTLETLQLSMAQAEVRDLELARSRDERSRLEEQITALAEENRRLRAGMAALNAGLAEILGVKQDFQSPGL